MRESKKDLLRTMGFNREVDSIELGLCPLCQKMILTEDFKDELSRREFKISGMCQSCQDDVFNQEQ